MSCEFAHSDAAYVLGSLSPSERVAFEQHLPACESCSRSVRELAGLPGLLSRVSPDVLESSWEPVPATLLPALTKRARKMQRKRRLATGAVAAVATGAVVAGTAAVVNSLGGSQPQAGPSVVLASPMAMQRVGGASMDAEVALTSVPWGTRLDITCQYDVAELSEYPTLEMATYALVVRTSDGRQEEVATWHIPAAGTMHLTAGTAVSKADIVEVSVQLVGGPTQMRLVT